MRGAASPEPRTAVVLGGSEGIGLGCARRLLESGRRVVLFSRSTEKLIRACTSLPAFADRLSWVAGDLASREDLARLFGRVQDDWGGCDILVSNGGGPESGGMQSLSDDDWHLALDRLALPVFRAIRHVLPRMRERAWGRIILIASSSVREPIPDLDRSNFMRAGLTAVLKALSREVAAQGITVSTVCPGRILTSRSEARIRKRAEERGISYEESLQTSASTIPAGRLGSADEVGSLVAFLASDEASYLTGNLIQVDGGMSTGT